jgi:hypothetical protein
MLIKGFLDRIMNGGVRTVLPVMAVFALTRLIVLAVIYGISGGSEFTSDVHIHIHLAGAPLEPLMGIRYWSGQYPPLQGLVESVLILPLRAFMGEFMAIRISFMIWEAIALFLAWRCLECIDVPVNTARTGILLLAVVPAGWMTSTVMAQEEFMAGAFIAGSVLLWARGRRTLAIVLCGLGAGAGKIFLVLPLAALVLTALLEGGGLRPLLAGALSSGMPYVIVAIAYMLRGEPPPLSGFTPPFDFTSGIWNLASWYTHISGAAAKHISLALGLAFSLAPLLWMFITARLRGISTRGLAMTMVVMLMWFFNVFYHVNPEYYALVLPLMAVAVRDLRALFIGYMVVSLPWAVNFFHGVSKALDMGAGQGQGGFIRLFDSLFSGGPDNYLKAALIISVLSNLALTLWFTAMLFKDKDMEATS